MSFIQKRQQKKKKMNQNHKNGKIDWFSWISFVFICFGGLVCLFSIPFLFIIESIISCFCSAQWIFDHELSLKNANRRVILSWTRTFQLSQLCSILQIFNCWWFIWLYVQWVNFEIVYVQMCTHSHFSSVYNLDQTNKRIKYQK